MHFEKDAVPAASAADSDASAKGCLRKEKKGGGGERHNKKWVRSPHLKGNRIVLFEYNTLQFPLPATFSPPFAWQWQLSNPLCDRFAWIGSLFVNEAAERWKGRTNTIFVILVRVLSTPQRLRRPFILGTLWACSPLFKSMQKNEQKDRNDFGELSKGRQTSAES